MSELIQVKDKQWHEERLKGIGGSEAAAVMELSRYDSPMGIFLLKTGQKPPFQGNEYTKWGQILEPIIRRVFSEETKLTVIYDPSKKTSKENDFMFAHLDGIIYDDETETYGVLEIKNVDKFKKSEWENDDVPIEAMIQIQHNMYVTETGWGYFAALIGGNHLVITKVYRDEELINQIIEKEKEFWYEYVLPGKEPPYDGSNGSEKVLKELFPLARKTNVISLSPKVEDWIGELVSLEEFHKENEKKIKKIKQQIKNELGEYETGQTESYTVKWTNVRQFNYERFKKENKKLLEKIFPEYKKVEFDQAKFKKDYPEIYEKYLEPHHRKFQIND